MNYTHIIIFVAPLVCFIYCSSPNAPIKNNTTSSKVQKNSLSTAVDHSIQKVKQIPLPDDFYRFEEAGEMTNFCRNLNLKPFDSPVKLYNGKLKPNQSAHYAILTIDVGTKDLQQCADAVMRLRAAWQKWRQGWRPAIQHNKVTWNKTKKLDDSYSNFRKYLNMVFTYAGSASLSKELKSVDFKNMQIGDVLIQGGFPGHAVIVLDMAQKNNTEKIYLLAQSYMPAQDIHILLNPNDAERSPWYTLGEINEIETPEWTFKPSDLKRF